MVMVKWEEKQPRVCIAVLQEYNMRSVLLVLLLTFLVLSSCCVAAFPRNIGVPVPYGEPCAFSRLSPKPKGLSVHAECSSPCALELKQDPQLVSADHFSSISSNNLDESDLLIGAAVGKRDGTEYKRGWIDLSRARDYDDDDDDVDVRRATTVEEGYKQGATTGSSRRLLTKEDCSNWRRGECEDVASSAAYDSRRIAAAAATSSYERFSTYDATESGDYLPYDTSANVEAQILISLKKGLNDAESNALANWNFTVQPQFCNWTGVECDLSNQHVVSIQLNRRSLSGYITPGLSGLPLLAALDMSYNRLNGEIPADLVNASVLVNLDLSYNLFTGPIPPFGLMTPILGSLNLEKNRLSGGIPASLGECVELRNINFNRNKLRGSIPDVLGSLVNLQTLYLNSNRLTGEMPASLGSCKSLLSLDVGWNGITGHIPETYSGLESLEGLYLYGNYMDGLIPEWLSTLPQLSYLHLYANDFSGRIPQELGSTGSLQSINLSNNSLTGPVPSSLSISGLMWEIDLSVNNITGSIPSEFGELSKLRELRLESNLLTGVIPSTLRDCQELISIALSGNQLTGPILDLAKLRNLERLSLEQNSLNGSIPASLTGCTNLSELNLSRNLLTGSIPEEIGSLKDLVTLGLSDNHLAGVLPPSLVECTRLEHLRISNNSLKGEIPEGFELMQSLKYVDLSNNLLEGDLPEDLGKLTNLEYLNLAKNAFENEIPVSVGNLVRLQVLSLGGNGFTNSIPSQLSELDKLQTLALNDNDLDGPIPESLGRLQNLYVLHLQGNELSGAIPSTLSNLTKLEDLDLADNKLSGKISPSLLKGLSGLQANFSLGNNRMSGSIPPEIGLLSTVEGINLSSNDFTGTIPGAIGNCSSLLRLDLSGNELSGPLPGSLQNLHSLLVLDVSNNQLTGAIPSSLGKLKSLVNLDLSVNEFNGSFPSTLEGLNHLKSFNVSENKLSGNLSLSTDGIFKAFKDLSFLGMPDLCGAILSRQCQDGDKGNSPSMWIYIGVAIGAFIILAILAVALFLWCRSPMPVPGGANRGSIIARSELFYPQLRFTAQDLRLATENFSEVNVLGNGCMSQVYRGVLPELVLVAVKKLKIPQGKDIPSGFVQELHELGRLRHKHLVAVLGYCFDGELNALVVQFMSNGSLEEHLHKGKTCDLDWAARAKIAIGVAKALTYLHHECGSVIVHCDLKPSNILLDAEYEPHLEDFGLSRLIFFHKLIDMSDSSLGNSIGYFPPEYKNSATVSAKGDVYSYGITLLEMLTGKRPSSDMFTSEVTIRKWCQTSYPENTQEVLDPNLVGMTGSSMRQINLFMKVALMCTREIPEERPTMRAVVDMLR